MFAQREASERPHSWRSVEKVQGVPLTWHGRLSQSVPFHSLTLQFVAEPLKSDTSHDTTASQPLPNCGLSSMIPDDSISYIFPRKHKRQRRSSTAMDDFGSNSDDEQGPFSGFSGTTSRKLVQLVVGDDSAMNKWYEDAFHTIQQVVCRSIAKLWIKRIQPKKQSTNPYNGACSKDKDMPKDPNRTRPPYWPPHVKHKEPDHINKEGLYDGPLAVHVPGRANL